MSSITHPGETSLTILCEAWPGHSYSASLSCTRWRSGGKATSHPRSECSLRFCWLTPRCWCSIAGGLSQRGIRPVDAHSGRQRGGARPCACRIGVSLTVIGIIRFDEGLDATMGRIVMESVPFSIGIGVANNFLHKQRKNSQAVKTKTPNRTSGTITPGTARWPTRGRPCSAQRLSPSLSRRQMKSL